MIQSTLVGMNYQEVPAMRYIVVDRAAGETLCITSDLEEACTILRERIGYSAEVHAVPARTRTVVLGRRTRDAGTRVVENAQCRMGVPFLGMFGIV
ncbi:hypothetical protein RJ40_03390 [Methanofollis aquaemaris]|uniref:Uncharacterized protein n=1 Tax=Methanofollis aquaemaris TaxID=126734 RepID=A0A8A3S379_9EURY|nr:hypothetical protein [Methanofollis aquaemaris]QSZ66608.1 hypothetical protein RJ40_03390 [Methanofollis aquaemaris]